MSGLLPILNTDIDGELTQTVNARALHEKLGVKKKFPDWIKDQLSRGQLVENADYLVLPQKGKNPNGGRPLKDYHITLDAAKSIAMMSGTEKGKEVRQYFIQCEKDLRMPVSQLSRMDILQLAMDAEKEVQVLTHQVEELKPKADFHDKVVISEDAIPVSKAAKIIGTGRTRLFAFMRQMKWITRTNEPYQSKIESGHLDVKIGTWNHSERGLQETITTLITGKGLAALQKAYMERIGFQTIHPVHQGLTAPPTGQLPPL